MISDSFPRLPAAASRNSLTLTCSYTCKSFWDVRILTIVSFCFVRLSKPHLVPYLFSVEPDHTKYICQTKFCECGDLFELWAYVLASERCLHFSGFFADSIHSKQINIVSQQSLRHSSLCTDYLHSLQIHANLFSDPPASALRHWLWLTICFSWILPEKSTSDNPFFQFCAFSGPCFHL